MTEEATQSKGIAKPEGAAPTIEDRSYQDILKSLLGKTVTVVNPESYEGAPVGYQLRTNFYRAKATGLGNDYLILVTEFTPSGRKVAKEPVKQYIPLHRIKRVSMTKSERIIHI